AVDDGRLITVTAVGEVVALDAGSGAVAWQTQLGDPSRRWCWGTPAVGGRRVFVGAAAWMAALSTVDGRELWARAGLAPEDWMASHTTPAPVDDVVVVGFGNERVHLAALDAASGEERWRHRGNELSASSSSPVIADGTAYVCTVDGWLRAVEVA